VPDLLEIQGRAINISDEVLPTVILQADFLDEDGQYLTFRTVDYTDIQPKEEWDFIIQFPNKEDEDVTDEVESFDITVHEDRRTVDVDKDYDF
jgi:hypothetical protein